MIASIENMMAVGELSGVFAYSHETGEEYSAHPRDYWNVRSGWVMLDSKGKPMELVERTRGTTSVELPKEEA